MYIAYTLLVIAANLAGIKVVPHIINAVVLTSAWSSGNSGLLIGSRTLYGIAREGHAPKIFLRCNRWGIPYVAVVFIGMFIVRGPLLSQSHTTLMRAPVSRVHDAGQLCGLSVRLVPGPCRKCGPGALVSIR